jgi:hypothetical protein
MRAKLVPGLRPWVIATGENTFTIYEGVEPPSPEWIERARKFAKFLIEVIHPMVMAEYKKEFSGKKKSRVPRG